MVEKLEWESPVDKKIEVTPKMAEGASEALNISVPSQQVSAPVSLAQNIKLQEKDEELLMIEDILSEDVSSVYAELSAARQAAFKKRGEETALRIKILLKQTKVKIHEIFELIKNWLLMLPKISGYFLEQEAKIKTDKVMQLKKEGQEIQK